MNEFDTLEKVSELFKAINYTGNENNIFFAYKNNSKYTSPMGGAVGAFANGMVNGMNYPYDAVLINQTENGIGMILLKQPGVPLVYKLEKMEIQKDKYIFIPYESIKEIKIKKLALFNKKRKSVLISTTDGLKYYLIVDINQPLLPYHNSGFARFMEKFTEK